ncbi:hypothetical protein V5799_004366 [Amblyomma americanum]|uniref:Uncharacterized protein n=1 Tax=Amblyomma americanum TaxID=6943 RepID=A0AAQ4D6B3_AMBAM
MTRFQGSEPPSNSSAPTRNTFDQSTSLLAMLSIVPEPAVLSLRKVLHQVRQEPLCSANNWLTCSAFDRRGVLQRGTMELATINNYAKNYRAKQFVRELLPVSLGELGGAAVETEGPLDLPAKIDPQKGVVQ